MFAKPTSRRLPTFSPPPTSSHNQPPTPAQGSKSKPSRAPNPSYPPLPLTKPNASLQPDADLKTQIRIRHLPSSAPRRETSFGKDHLRPPYRLEVVQAALSSLGLRGTEGVFDEEMGFKVVVEAGDVQKWLAVDGLEVEGERFVANQRPLPLIRSALVGSSRAPSITTTSIFASSSPSSTPQPSISTSPLRSRPSSSISRPSFLPSTPTPSPASTSNTAPSASSASSTLRKPLPLSPTLSESLDLSPTSHLMSSPSPTSPPPSRVHANQLAPSTPLQQLPRHTYSDKRPASRISSELLDFLRTQGAASSTQSSSSSGTTQTAPTFRVPPPSFMSLPTRKPTPPVVLQPPPDFVPSKTFPVQLACVWVRSSPPCFSPLGLLPFPDHFTPTHPSSFPTASLSLPSNAQILVSLP
ncbi:hypothetical protein BDY24DRAFT_266129 [Mrakia frigida]|uniref:uncharacterized protein n=1 Tax=Mrakia frigida TaxID=29902 RepID=UPI003FCC1458